MNKKAIANDSPIVYSRIVIIVVFIILGAVAITITSVYTKAPALNSTAEDKIINSIVGCVNHNCTKLNTQELMTTCMVNCWDNYFYVGIKSLGYGSGDEDLFISALNIKNQAFYNCTKESGEQTNGGFSASGNYSMFRCYKNQGIKFDWSLLTK